MGLSKSPCPPAKQSKQIHRHEYNQQSSISTSFGNNKSKSNIRVTAATVSHNGAEIAKYDSVASGAIQEE